MKTEVLSGKCLSIRLKTETALEHERMERLMEKAKVFDNKKNYQKFTLSQYYFQKEIEHLYQSLEIAELIPDLEIRGRSLAALQDLKDLGVEPQGSELKTASVGFPQSLGWIYVSEGSTLGAAFLFNEAKEKLGLNETFGARNLAAYPEGRAKVWKRFKQVLDDANFSEIQQSQVIEGAMQGFSRFGQLLEEIETLK